MKSDCCWRDLPKLRFLFSEFHWRTKWHLYLHKICLENPWGFPFVRDFGLNVNCKIPPRKLEVWPAATLLFGGERKQGERENMLCNHNAFERKKNRHKSNAFLKCQNRGQIGKFHAFLTAKIFHCKGNLNTKGQMSQIRNIFMAVMKSKWVFPRKEIPLVSQCILNRSWFALSN